MPTHHCFPTTAWLLHALSTPINFGLAIPVIFLDLCVEFYHRTCFPLYRLPYLTRSHYVIIDRYRLPYLSPLRKVFCFYCEYVNGVFHYVSAIAAATEAHFCNIQHEPHPHHKPPTHHQDFIPYGDATAFQQHLKKVKKHEI